MSNKEKTEQPKTFHLIYFIDKIFLAMVVFKICLFLNQNSVQHILNKRKMNTMPLFKNQKEYILKKFSIAQSPTYH